MTLCILPLSWNSYLYHQHKGLIQHISLHLSFGLQPSRVEYIAIKTVPDWKISVTVLKSTHEHGRKHHAEQCWCHNTDLFDPICYLKGFRELSIILYTCLHAIMELPHHCYESGWTAKLGNDFQISDPYFLLLNVFIASKGSNFYILFITTNCVKSFGEVDKRCV